MLRGGTAPAQKSAAAQDVLVRVRGYDAAAAVRRLIEGCDRLGAPGHSFGVVSDDKPAVTLGGWDGDGGMRAEVVSVTDVPGSPARVKDHTLKRDDGWHAYSRTDGSHLSGPHADHAAALAAVAAEPDEVEKSVRVELVLKADDASPEERYVLGIVLVPERVDSQGDVYSAAEIRKTAHRWMRDFRNLDLQHKVLINHLAMPVESWLAPADFKVGERVVKAGTWLLAAYVADDDVWAQVKSGALTGWSISGLTKKTPVAVEGGLRFQFPGKSAA